MSCAVGPAGVLALGCAFTRRDFGEARRHDLAPRRVGRGIGEQRLQGGLGRGGIAALQRGLGAVKAGARIIAGFGELGFRGGGHDAVGGQHQDFAELGMQPLLVGCQGDRAAIGVTRLGEALQPRQGPTEQSPAFGMVGIALEACLQLIGCSGELGQIMWTGAAHGARSRWRIDRDGRADREVNGECRRRYQAGYADRGTDAPRNFGGAARSEVEFVAFPIGCRQHAAG